WDDEQPYYGLFVERADIPNADFGARIAEALDDRLCESNIEYAGKRSSLRLGPVRMQIMPDGTWHDWDRQRVTQTGGVLEQYKHPCLIPDIGFRQSMPVEEEASTSREEAGRFVG